MARTNSNAAPGQEVSEETAAAEPVITEANDDFPEPESGAEAPQEDLADESEAAAEQAADLAAEEPEAAAEAEAEPEPLPTHIAMLHPDNGSCDRYESDEAGNILVPVEEVALMLEHGFVAAEG